MTIDYGFDCTCGAPIEIEVVVTHGGTPSSYDYPGDAPEWELKRSDTCDPSEGGCGRVWDDEAVAAVHEDKIQQHIHEAYLDRMDDYYED